MYRLIAFVNLALIKMMLKLKQLKQSDEGDGFPYTIISLLCFCGWTLGRESIQ